MNDTRLLPCGGTRDHLLTSGEARHLAVLERRAPMLTSKAAELGCPITYLGTAPLFTEPRAYSGSGTDWVIAPASEANDLVVPRAIREKLKALDDAGIVFPLIYLAHEVPGGRLPVSSGYVNVDRSAAERAVGPVPPSAEAVAVADRLGRRSQSLLNVLGKAIPVVAGIVAAPVVIAGAAIGALAGLDPVVFGVVPAGAPRTGRPAAWYVLASWVWDSPSG